MKPVLMMILLLICTPVGAEQARILAIGDSFFATHSGSERSIPDVVERELSQRVANRSVMGARIIYNLPLTGAMGFNISRQYRGGPWNWVIMNGGGNDLWLGCGCSRCDRKMTKMISKDGTRGEIPALVSKMRRAGSRVVYVGYLRSPGRGSPIEHCRDEGNELDARVTRMAARDKGVYFVPMADLVPSGDRSFHTADMIHPSPKGTAAVGKRVAKVIAEAGG
ncbi:SGNH/GDSL hydrolase family protein [Pseudosulfitobacter koreensis]|uniref:SGNH/GDSL hydrolase family protein n=1 Tax=Pseudosulfitobacter koreensis TaxID=2968472 RepID=A0ABT1YW94_9RHOB|nr:SGNH/GDSL hydrolase family protein [Pseudosulfitobacter koreense]MCR8825140.1 SGNH/GDSL hydrolase family protein [Pseudosulfitobacter koreense]